MDVKQEKIVPFWDVMPQFFLMPLKGAGIIALLILTVLATYFSSSLIHIILVFISVKYGAEILRNTAEGIFKPPALNGKVLNENYELPFKLLLLAVLPLLLFSQVNSFIAFIIVSNIVLLYTFLLPASVMTLAYTNSFFSAINPFVLISLVQRIGWSYVIMYLLLILLNGSASTAYYFVMGDGVELSLFFAVLFQIYFIWVMCSMMGYVLYQYHEEIGYEPPNMASKQADTHSVLTHFDALVEAENYPEAESELKRLILQDQDNLELRIKFHKIVKLNSNTAQLTKHGRGLIRRLLSQRKAVDAVGIYFDCLSVDASFKPESDADYLPLTEEMRRMRRFKEVLALCNGFHDDYPESTMTPNLYLLIVKVFIEDLADDDKALPVLAFLEKSYPDHHVQQKVASYRRFLASH